MTTDGLKMHLVKGAGDSIELSTFGNYEQGETELVKKEIKKGTKQRRNTRHHRRRTGVTARIWRCGYTDLGVPRGGSFHESFFPSFFLPSFLLGGWATLRGGSYRNLLARGIGCTVKHCGFRGSVGGRVMVGWGSTGGGWIRELWGIRNVMHPLPGSVCCSTPLAL